MKTSKLDAASVLEWANQSFSIDLTNGRFIWTNPPRVHPRMLGKEAGSPRLGRGKPYIHIKYKGRALKRSWLVFLCAYGRWPKECLDHIDRNSLNDALSNIREATVLQNAWNHRGRKKSTALPMGIRQLASGRYNARIAINRKSICLGTFETLDAAHEAYTKTRRELFGDYSGL